MDGIVININWEYFLGLIGTIIGIAYYANGRLARLETSVEWLKEAIRGLTLGAPRITSRKPAKVANARPEPGPRR
jgi:hypothetical protein